MPVTEIHQLLTHATIRVGLVGANKAALLDALVDLLEGHPHVLDLEGVRHAVHEREARMSTGVGKGLALPHGKTCAVAETVAAFAVAEEAVAFDAIDNVPVRLLFLLVGPESAKSQHIKLLSRVSRLMNRDPFRTRLLEAQDADDVLRIFEEGEMELI